VKKPTLQQMKQATPPGLCPFCLDPIKQNPRGRTARTCGDRVCAVTAYNRVYQRSYRRKTAVDDPLAFTPAYKPRHQRCQPRMLRINLCPPPS